MFVKLIVLILALGSTGAGVLSVRHSRLVASNEMTISRMRARQHQRRSMELRAQISQRITPDQIHAMLGNEVESLKSNQPTRRVDLLISMDPEPALDHSNTDTQILNPEEPGHWTLDDGTRIYLLVDED